MCGLTFELTGPLRWDGLARAGKMYRVPQAGPRRPAVAGPVVQRGVRPPSRSGCGSAYVNLLPLHDFDRLGRKPIEPDNCAYLGGTKYLGLSSSDCISFFEHRAK
jgi:hypothetical protein